MSNTIPLLSRRERQMMDVIYKVGKATAADVAANLPDPPSDSAVRTTLRILEDKGHLRHEQDGPRYVYLPTVKRERAQRSALRNMLSTFFDGSPGEAVAALFDEAQGQLTAEDLDRIARLISEARKKGR